tara:strand:+ start:38 stop:283 length:246 start_codon:yes stop_codon:yes gene_type:complete
MAFKMKGYSAFTKSPMKQDIEKEPRIGSTIRTFDQAFAAARNAGRETFIWEGKSYHTKTKEEVEKLKEPTLRRVVRPAKKK